MNRVFSSHGEPLRYCYFEGTVTDILYQIKAFWNEAKIARNFLNFMYDGIVISYLDENIRNQLGRKNFINKYSMAVKFDPLEKQTIFRGYTYEIGQHGTITPMLHYDPVEFIDLSSPDDLYYADEIKSLLEDFTLSGNFTRPYLCTVVNQYNEVIDEILMEIRIKLCKNIF